MTDRSQGSRGLRLLGRALLLLYPPSFRREVGSEILRDLELEAAAVRARPHASYGRWSARTARVLVAGAVSEWREGPDPRALAARIPDEKSGALDMFRQDLSFAVRTLRRRPAFAFVAVLTLALGIGSTTAMFSVVRGILLRPLPFPDSEELVTVWETGPEGLGTVDGGLISHADFRDVRDEIPSIGEIALANSASLTVTEDGGAEYVPGARATPGLFAVLETPLLAGRDFTAVEDTPEGPRVAIVAADYWRDRFGDVDDAIGSAIRIGGESHEVVGVAPHGFGYPDDAVLWLPARNDEEGCGRGCVNRGSVARLADGATLESARAELATMSARLESQYPDSNTDKVFAVATLHDVTVGDVRPALWLLLGAVGMVLLIACANVANLILVRGRGRVTEVAIRTTLGAGRRRILKQLMTESGLLALLGGLAGVALAWVGVDLVLAVAPPDIPRLDEVTLDAMSLAFAGLLVVVTTAVFGATPALLVSGIQLTRSLRDGGRGDVTGGRSGRARTTILTAEVALSVMLLVGAGLMVRSLARTTDVDPGFDATDVAIFRLSLPRASYDPEARVQFMDRLLERLNGLPGVESAAIFLAPPLSSVSIWGGFSRTDRPPPEPGEGPTANYRSVGPGALELLGIPIVAGRAFRDSDRRDAEPVVIISERLAAENFPGEDPIGRRIDLQVSTGFPEDAPRTIVGVAGDFRAARLTRTPGRETLVPFAQIGAGFPHVLMKGVDPGAMLDAARAELRALDPELPLMQPSTIEQLAAAQLAQPRFYLLLFGILSVLAVVLAAVGMYGVVAYAVSQRTKEIGVRMALGADGGQVIALVLRQGLVPAGLGLLIGLTGALMAGGVMRGLLYEVAPQDPVTLVAVPVLLLAVVVAACAIPARRATRVSPASALRSE
ncbi:MAG: ABC transporter permease [Gemmatimonadota bacterium]|nr:ABC transporter permease [Gemmatimonadota bacterium]